MNIHLQAPPWLPPAVWVYLLSLLPSVEARYALPVGVSLGVPPAEAALAAGLGVATLSLALPPALAWAHGLAERLASRPRGALARLAGLYLRYARRARERAGPAAERWGLLGVVAFVAAPLPGTGVWTGALAAHLLGIPRRRAAAALLAGGLLSEALTGLPTLALGS
ncbi:MAG: small multi-drug export protein [Desulfurococcales archaeon]|nr:small multi-drug export protein [Desulfurococcales archaeon]